MTTNWPLDWKNPKEYPPEDGTSMRQWAWEFMRRNPEYAQDIREINMVFRITLLSSSDQELARKLTDNEKFDKRQYFTDKYACEFANGATLPEDSRPPMYAAEWIPMSTIAFPVYTKPTTWSHFTARFDLSLPIKAQIRAVETNLKEAIKSLDPEKVPKPKNLHPDKYPIYLRLIDANNTGASQEEISEFIYGTNGALDEKTIKSIRDNTRAAHQLRDFGFRQLPYLYTNKSRSRKKIENKTNP